MSQRVPDDTILVTGLTSLRPFAMELENLGNFVIIEPFFRTLREAYPRARILTTLQLTPTFEARVGIEVLRDRRVWGKGWRPLLSALGALARACLGRLLGGPGRARVGTMPQWITRGNPRVDMVAHAGLVLDFSGDMLGDNGHGLRHLFLGWSTVAVASLYGTPVYSIASSPGPFRKRFRAIIARDTLRRCRLVSTRDPVSRERVEALGAGRTRITTHPCPSFGFRPLQGTTIRETLLAREPELATGGPTVGLIVADLNMAKPPLYRWPRSDKELAPFVELVHFMVGEMGVRVCIMSHQNGTDPDFELVQGPDHRVVRRLVELVAREEAFTLRGLYDTSEMHRLISGLDALVSGRIHGAVQGLSQGIPTAIIEYRLPPPAHKHRGFARLVGMEQYLCHPDDPDGMRTTVGRLWRERAEIRQQLETRVPELVAGSRRLWDEIRDDWRSREAPGPARGVDLDGTVAAEETGATRSPSSSSESKARKEMADGSS